MSVTNVISSRTPINQNSNRRTCQQSRGIFPHDKPSLARAEGSLIEPAPGEVGTLRLLVEKEPPEIETALMGEYLFESVNSSRGRSRRQRACASTLSRHINSSTGPLSSNLITREGPKRGKNRWLSRRAMPIRARLSWWTRHSGLPPSNDEPKSSGIGGRRPPCRPDTGKWLGSISQNPRQL